MEATIILTPRAKAAIKRAGVKLNELLERYAAGDTGDMAWDVARVMTKNRLEGLPYYSRFQITKRLALRIRTDAGVIRVSVSSY